MRIALLFLSFLAVAVFSQTCPRCTPLCENGDGTPKLCGDDGCGGSCGTCPAGQACCRGACACVPNCVGRACGDDGCGGQSCGRCASTQTCQSGQCVGTATAECAGRVCGDNRAGGSCGSCQPGQRCRAGVCECYYDCEERNCGTAPQPAGANTALCPQRTCGSCPTGFTCGASGRCNQETPCNVLISVVDCDTRASLTVSASVSISWSTSVSYSGSVQVPAGGVGNWTTPGLGEFTFRTSASGYLENSETQTVIATTTALTVCVRKGSVRVDVRNRATNVTISPILTQVSYSGFATGSFSWSQEMSFVHGGYGSYSFNAVPSSTYGAGQLTVTIDASTVLIIIYVDANPVQIDVRERSTNNRVTIPIAITYSGQGTGSFTWTNIFDWSHNGYGSYTFVATDASGKYATETHIETVSASTALIVILLDSACGNGVCAGTENNFNCPEDCLQLIIQFENLAGNGPVNGVSILFYAEDPRQANADLGPTERGITHTKNKTASPGSNLIIEDTTTRGSVVWLKASRPNYINFFWKADTSDPLLITVDGSWYLRVHLAETLTSNHQNYRFVNTWRPNDQLPDPKGPTDLNLHVFHPDGELDVSNTPLTVNGNQIGVSVSDVKQSGGPAAIDISPGAGVEVAVWNSKPPRNPAVAASQNDRFLVDSGSYLVVYGKTSDAQGGKQLGELTLHEYLHNNPSMTSSPADLWYIARVRINSPAMNQPTITPVNTLKNAEINGERDMIFDCEIYSRCARFVVPYSDKSNKK